METQNNEEHEVINNHEEEDHNNELQDDHIIDDDDELLRGPFPGGPVDPSLLCSFKTHVATTIWNGQERDVLKCWSLASRLLKWTWPTDSRANTWKTLVKRSGLTRLRNLSYKAHNRNLISAFVERWQLEKNSFHLPFGEMTITLDDVFSLTGLNVTGRPVQLVGEDVAPGPAHICRLLGVPAEEAKAAVSERGCLIRLRWLQDNFKLLMTTNDETTTIHAARAYILYTLGCTIFVDKSGDKVSCSYLRFLEHPDEFGEYAWGAAALAFYIGSLV